MKILMISPQPFFASRGTPFSVYYRTQMLSDLGYKIDLLTYHLGMDVMIKNVNIIRIPGFPFIYNIKIGPSFTKLILDVILFFKALYLIRRNKYDIIHAHEEAVFFCLLFNKLFKIKYIYDMHSSLPQQLENFNFTKMKFIKRFFEYLEKLAISRASAVITICKELEDQVKRFGYSEKSELIQNTIFSPVDLLEDLCNVELGNIIKTDNKRIVLYTGTFEPYQGLDMYLNSIEIILKKRKDILFVFIGGNSVQVLKMRAKAEELKVSENTIFTGMLEANIVKNFIKKAEVLVSPRIKGTNTPLKIYEYMASGVPIVATNLKTHTQELDNNCAFLRSPTPEEFAMGILESIEDRMEAKRRARNAFIKYNKQYGEATYKNKLRNIMENAKRAHSRWLATG